MKNLMMLALSLMTAATVTFAPQTSKASTNAVDVLIGVAEVALVAVEIHDLIKCSEGQSQYCDYTDYNHCEYQECHTHEVIESCRSYGRYSTYDCVKSRQDSTTYIRSCNGGFHNRY